jgi:hypothetical protein
MNTHSAREYIMFAHAQLLSNWREQRPSNKGDLESSVTGESGSVLHVVDLLLILFLYRSEWLLLGCVVSGRPALYTKKCVNYICVFFQCIRPTKENFRILLASNADVHTVSMFALVAE